MKESKAMSLGFSKQIMGDCIIFNLARNGVIFGYSKCRYSGNNLGYWISKGNEVNSISNKESFEYLLTVYDPWELSAKIKD